MNGLQVPLLLDAIVVLSYMSNSTLDQWLAKEYLNVDERIMQ